jgi:hypothetical protein
MDHRSIRIRTRALALSPCLVIASTQIRIPASALVVDRPGLASDFREVRSEAVAKKRRLTLEEWNRISEKYGTTHKTIE